MKILAINEKGEYIAVVNHSELEQCADKYYGHLPKLKPTDEFDIGAGYRFRGDIKAACDRMTEATKAFHSAQETMLAFAVMLAKVEDKP